jgi:hypothetical protein
MLNSNQDFVSMDCRKLVRPPNVTPGIRVMLMSLNQFYLDIQSLIVFACKKQKKILVQSYTICEQTIIFCVHTTVVIDYHKEGVDSWGT